MAWSTSDVSRLQLSDSKDLSIFTIPAVSGIHKRQQCPPLVFVGAVLTAVTLDCTISRNLAGGTCTWLSTYFSQDLVSLAGDGSHRHEV
jgi:hypothetical protein